MAADGVLPDAAADLDDGQDLVAVGELDLVARRCHGLRIESCHLVPRSPFEAGSVLAMSDRTSSRGILAGPVDGPRSRATSYPLVDAVVGLVVTHLGSRFRGSIQRIDHDGGVVLRSAASGSERVFRM